MHFVKPHTIDLCGFALENGLPGQVCKALQKATLTSDEADFYTYIEHISNTFFNDLKIPIDSIFQFIILRHADGETDIYTNDDLQIVIKIMTKRNIEKGESVYQNDIADITSLKFNGINILESDKIICCLKIGWKFGLLFDLARPEKLNSDAIESALGALYRYLSFQYVYRVLERAEQFDAMLKDGWFPFIDIIGFEYKKLSEVYQNKFNFENRILEILKNFDRARINNITQKWWSKDIFNKKRPIIEAGINAFNQDNNEGYINCIKNLLSEIDGILRLLCFQDTGKEGFPDSLRHIGEKASDKSGSDYSLLFPSHFLKYLKEVIFAAFDLKTNEINLSRHSAEHGVATPEIYTRERALQAILTLDQIYFYI